MKVFSLFKMTFLLIRVRYHFMYQDMVSSAVFSLAKWTFCQPQLNVLHTEIGCAWLCWCGCVQRVHVWVIGRGVEDSREKVQLGDNNNKYESESEWSEQCLKPKNFHNSVMGGTHVSLWAREPLNSQKWKPGDADMNRHQHHNHDNVKQIIII